MVIDVELAKSLVATQFPIWKDLNVRPVAVGGWDNRSFHLGEEMLVRMPSGEKYALNVQKEQLWLPKLAPLLPLQIPEPLTMGKPGEGYPWSWSIYRWIKGDTANTADISDLNEFASSLAQFLTALHRIDTTGAPLAGPHNFHRGGSLKIYDAETRHALKVLNDKIDLKTATEIWQEALATEWQGPPLWVHGDVSAGNLLASNGRLTAVIDFGGLAIGDPACDLVIAWTFFKGKSREVFRANLPFDANAWVRGRAWALWKALIVIAGFTETNSIERSSSQHTLDEVIADHLKFKNGNKRNLKSNELMG